MFNDKAGTKNEGGGPKICLLISGQMSAQNKGWGVKIHPPITIWSEHECKHLCLRQQDGWMGSDEPNTDGLRLKGYKRLQKEQTTNEGLCCWEGVRDPSAPPVPSYKAISHPSTSPATVTAPQHVQAYTCTLHWCTWQALSKSVRIHYDTGGDGNDTGDTERQYYMITPFRPQEKHADATGEGANTPGGLVQVCLKDYHTETTAWVLFGPSYLFIPRELMNKTTN
ncbi:hypothetical protein F5J12DRAFT_926899 [Pisolithus orientalis]|uniref:uncharacterized protein n=1 Tax=Pisolithus orientalis TaxID=936130 RepID=UPI00222469EA|nr:uncharacterized protein F5J12DRAFT_926899 [Pisolithus orientalis]KAI6009584.1 hypothetical protein F5J12DRAFT_926899 [Pisolithus orientalis]